ncbi:unnamed protein product, partial [marine sediment metagenome]
PPEYNLLLQGEELVPTREDFEVGRRFRAHRDKVPYEAPEEGEYEGIVSLVQRHNLMWQAAMDKSQRAMGRGGSQVVRTSQRGAAPAPGEQEPVVLKSESRVVKCTRCGTTFDIDLNEARQSAAAGKKLFVHCANPKCNFLLDLADLIPELKLKSVEATWPPCYAAGQDGKCNSELRAAEQCINCQWY